LAALSFLAAGMLILFFPIILAAAVAYVGWHRISRPWWFLLSATIILFGIYVIVTDYCRVPLVATLPAGKDGNSNSSDWSNLYALLPLWKPLSLLMIVSVPVLAALLRLFRRPVLTAG
jgi:hypothetical protein